MLKISKKLQSRIHKELQSGEIVVWAETPGARHIVRSKFENLLFYSLLVTLIFWSLTTIIFPINIVIILIGAFFLSVFIGILFNSNRRHKDCIYIITNLRALLLKNAKNEDFISYYPNSFTGLKKQKKKDGSGSIIFKTEYIAKPDGEMITHEHGFFSIRNTDRVTRLMENLVHKSSLINQRNRQ